MWDYLPPFCLLNNHLYSIHSAMSMAHAHILRESWKSLKKFRYETSAWLKPGLCMIWVFCVTKMEHSLTIWFCRDELSLAMLFWEDMIALLVCLKYYYFLCQYRLLSWIFQIWTFMPQLRELHWKTMLVSIPHQKFCFYHLPTRGRAGIKLGDAWYVSNVSIIFDCSMLLFMKSWMFNGLYHSLLYHFWD